MTEFNPYLIRSFKLSEEVDLIWNITSKDIAFSLAILGQELPVTIDTFNIDWCWHKKSKSKLEKNIKEVKDIPDLKSKIEQLAGYFAVGSEQDPEEQIPYEIKRKASDIAETGNPIQFFMDTYQKLHIGDKISGMVKLASIAITSVMNSDGIQPKDSGDSGKGKTHACKAVLHLIPKKWKVETSLSDKAIYYMDLKPGCIIFSDDVIFTEGLEGAIKRATSNFQQDTIHTTVDKGQLRQLKIPPRTVWWLTSVDDTQSLQLLNRQVIIDVDESSEQDGKVTEFQLDQAKNGIETLPETDDVLVCREIIRDIKQNVFIVKISFADGIVWREDGNRRNLPIFLDIIKSFAVLRYRQRVRGEGFLLATPEDFDDAQKLYDRISRTQALKLNQKEIEICEFISISKEADTESIIKKCKIGQARFSQIMNGRNNKTGLLEKVSGLMCDRVSETDNQGKYVYKNIYKLEHFDIQSLNTVVSLKPEAREAFYQLNHDFTSTLPDTIDNNNDYITTLPINTEDKGYNISNSFQVTSLKPTEMSNMVKSVQPIAETECKAVVN